MMSVFILRNVFYHCSVLMLMTNFKGHIVPNLCSANLSDAFVQK